MGGWLLTLFAGNPGGIALFAAKSGLDLWHFESCFYRGIFRGTGQFSSEFRGDGWGGCRGDRAGDDAEAAAG